VPAFLGPLCGFAIGVALAWLARVEAARRDDSGWGARAIVAALYGALVFAPACAYFLIFAGDWSLAYFLDSRTIPSAIGLVVVIVDAASVPLGLLAARRALARRSSRLPMVLGIVPVALAVGLILALFPRLRVEGTYHQIRSDFGTQPVAGGPLGYAILWMNAVLVGGFVAAMRAMSGRGFGAAKEPVSEAPPEAPQGYLGRRGKR
jgi:hypothetical protein